MRVPPELRPHPFRAHTGRMLSGRRIVDGIGQVDIAAADGVWTWEDVDVIEQMERVPVQDVVRYHRARAKIVRDRYR